MGLAVGWGQKTKPWEVQLRNEMVVVRNRLSLARAGGPRQFAELRDKLLIRVSETTDKDVLRSDLLNLGVRGDALDNAPVVTAEPEDKIEEVIQRITEGGDVGTKVRQGISEIQQARDDDESILDATSATLEATQKFIDGVTDITGVVKADFVRTQADFGPENLRFRPGDLDDLMADDARDAGDTLEDVINDLGIPDVWETTRGENAIVCIFDTGYAEDLIDSSRIVGTFHGGGTDSVYASSEGHGTMCAGAAAANSDEGVPFDGAAPDAGVALVRITDSEGQIRGDIISKGWDWLMSQDFDRPVITNHSYGTPLCSGRPRTSFCDTVENDVIRIANSDANITSCYAAGNEAMRCGHRLFGFTNGITGTNSIQEVITVGALLSDGREAQRYSSHGRGDCSPISDPKPNVTCPIPKRTYYGGDDGYMIKDMSTGVAGSSGGTSHASPLTAGILTLLQSAAVEEDGVGRLRSSSEPMQTEEIKQIIQRTAQPPRKTQVNSVGLLIGKKGYDARFGHGAIRPVDALVEV